MREWLGPAAKYVLFALFAACVFSHALATQRETNRLLRHRYRLYRQTARIRQENARRERILRALASDPFYVERLLRERYGYVRAGEERRPVPRYAAQGSAQRGRGDVLRD